MRRLLVFAAVLVTLSSVYVAVRLTRYLDTPMGSGSRSVEIAPGATFREAVTALQHAGVVSDWTVFYWYGRWRDLDRSVKAGRYAVDLAWTPRELMDRLARGTVPEQLRLTVPEGWNRWQIADRLAELGLDRAEFLRLVDARDLEGRLFPDTYFIGKQATVAEVAELMSRRFEAVLANLLKGHPKATRFLEPATRRRLIIMASLIEKEGLTDRDRRLIAAVFNNRLAQGMRLQTDPTCVYGEALYRKVPHPRYCKDPTSRYSTYVIDGLPPGPIANPGRSSLDAALRPATGPEADGLLYFVARRDGSREHAFSRTFDEHKAAVRKYLKP